MDKLRSQTRDDAWLMAEAAKCGWKFEGCEDSDVMVLYDFRVGDKKTQVALAKVKAVQKALAGRR